MSWEISSELSNSIVFDPEGREHRLGDSWLKQPVLLVFIRHFGWLLCQYQVAQLRLEVNSIRQTGAELVIVANGKPHHAETFRKDLKLTNPIFVDPQLGTYKALKLKYGVWSTLGPLTWWSAIIALSKGYRNKKYTGDVWQQGGTFLVMPNGQVPYHYISKHPGDHPNPKDFLAILNNIFKQAKLVGEK